MSSPKIRLLVVEDEADLRGAMVSYLALSGFAAEGVGSAQAMDAWLEHNDCDLIMLDLGLPDEDGLALAGRLRRKDRGVIICTARGTPAERMQGFLQGADHYLVKPVDLVELVAVARSLARRVMGESSVGTWRLDAKRWVLIPPDRPPVSLTRSEVVVLSALAEQPGNAVTRDALIERLGHNPQTYDIRRMEILVRRLRRKVETAASEALPLQTVHALGYAFTAPITVV